MSKSFRGSYTVAVTPFTDDGSAVDLDRLRRFIDWQLDCKVPGIIMLGTTGEFLCVSDSERRAIVEVSVEQAAGRMDVLIGTMDANTDKAVRYSREAQESGADGLMIIPPYYYTPTDDEIYAYYGAICDAVDLPIMLYNNPFTSNVDMSAKLVGRLTRAFDNVRYIKEASCDVGRVYDIVEETDGVMNVFAGERPVESYLLGAVGYVNPYGNYLPYSTTRMWEFLVDGRKDDAEAIQAILHRIYAIIEEGHPTYGHQCYSKALSAAAGYPTGDVRPPLTRFSELGDEGRRRRDEVATLMDEMERLMAKLEAKAQDAA